MDIIKFKVDKEELKSLGNGLNEGRKASKNASTGFHKTTIDKIFLRENTNNGAINMYFRGTTDEGLAIEFDQTIQLATAAGGGVTGISAAGNKYVAFGFTTLNTIAALALGKSVEELEQIKAPVTNLFNFETREKGVIIDLPTFPQLEGKIIYLGVQEKLADQFKTPEYFNRSFDINVIGNEEGFTLNELANDAEKPEQGASWLASLGTELVKDIRVKSLPAGKGKATPVGVETIVDETKEF